MKLPRPKILLRWNGTSQADRDYVEAWTNEQLDAYYEEQQQYVEPHYSEIDPSFDEPIVRELNQQLQRVRILQAVKAKDYKTLARLTVTEELRLVAYAQFCIRRKRGKPKGSRRRQQSDVELAVLGDAAKDKEIIEQIGEKSSTSRS